jgi:hypothetical protein
MFATRYETLNISYLNHGEVRANKEPNVKQPHKTLIHSKGRTYVIRMKILDHMDLYPRQSTRTVLAKKKTIRCGKTLFV